MIVTIQTCVSLNSDLIEDSEHVRWNSAGLELEVDLELRRVVSACPLLVRDVGQYVGLSLPLDWLRTVLGEHWEAFHEAAIEHALRVYEFGAEVA